MDYSRIGNLIEEKTKLNSLIQEKTNEAFSLLKQTSNDVYKYLNENHPLTKAKFEAKGDFEFKLSFGADTLIFLLHSNVFEFSRLHEVMKLPYIKEDNNRSYCGVVNIYNFLSDSILYNRESDYGYLIGRIFINKEGHYFIEGKREVGPLYTSFHNSVINEESIREIILSCMEYTNGFDLLTPPFDQVKVASLGEIQVLQSQKRQITGKRLGFEFEQDRT